MNDVVAARVRGDWRGWVLVVRVGDGIPPIQRPLETKGRSRLPGLTFFFSPSRSDPVAWVIPRPWPLMCFAVRPYVLVLRISLTQAPANQPASEELEGGVSMDGLQEHCAISCQLACTTGRGRRSGEVTSVNLPVSGALGPMCRHGKSKTRVIPGAGVDVNSTEQLRSWPPNWLFSPGRRSQCFTLSLQLASGEM